MSKKDYELIAKAIREWSPGGIEYAEITLEVRKSISRAIGSELLNTNPRFNLQRFIDACLREKVS